MSKVYVVEWRDKGKWKPVAEAQPKRKEARRLRELIERQRVIFNRIFRR